MKKLALIGLVAIIASFGFTACGDDDDDPEYVTKNVTVPEITFSAGASISFVQEYTPTGGWDSNFASTDITYILAFNSTALSAGTSSISASGRANGIYKLTQTFYYGGSAVGSRSVGVEVMANIFSDMYVSETDHTATNLKQLTLTLKKEK